MSAPAVTGRGLTPDGAGRTILSRMTGVDVSSVEAVQPGATPPDMLANRAARRRGFRWWAAKIAMGILLVWVLSTLFFLWIRWGRLDPNLGSDAREVAGNQLSPSEHPMYYPMLFLHVLGASIALATVVVQLMPWIRVKHPKVHRVVGRIYVFAGVLPAVLFALIVEAFWPFSVVTTVSQIGQSFIWAGTTVYGLILRRRGRIFEHRRWMLRSFAQTASALVVVVIDPFVMALVNTEMQSRLMNNPDVFVQVTGSMDNWVALVVVIVACELWLERDVRRRQRRIVRAPESRGREAQAIDAYEGNVREREPRESVQA